MMPISSSPNIRLTRTSLRPPPRSLEESILEHPPTSELNQQYYLSNSDFYIHQKTLFSDRNSPQNSRSQIRRESHLKDLPVKKKNSRVFPFVSEIEEQNEANRDPQNFSAVNEAGNAAININQLSCCEACCLATTRCCCFCCSSFLRTRCAWAALLTGFVIGALIIGLVVGLTLGSQLQEAEEELQQNLNCFQSPCSSGRTKCSYSTSLQFSCICLDDDSLNTNNIDGYNCTLYNTTTVFSTTSSLATSIP